MADDSAHCGRRRLKFKCNKCETVFEAMMIIRCPNCGETLDVLSIKKAKITV